MAIVNQYKLEPQLQREITPEQAYHYRIVPEKLADGTLHCLTDSNSVSELLKELSIVLDRKISLEARSREELNNYLAHNYRRNRNGLSMASQVQSQDFLEQLILRAHAMGSSDIHFEPYEQNCRVRFRLDGKLIEQASIAQDQYPPLVNKVKIRANLDISEKRLPQDGRITVSQDSVQFDIRVSTLPTLHGEKLVLRLLGKDSEKMNLEHLGFNAEEFRRYLAGVQKPHGILLISGPTGSGKTTTLYATLKHLNDGKTNILTVEDPIEYTLEGINQVQLKENIGLDFPNTLRTFLRQDPDIIMVGEIRDVKTANMAIRAALTGHLVLATIHTNSAWGTITRLLDMGVPGFLVASTLNLSVAQRLVRLLCESCKTPVNFEKAVLTGLRIAHSDLTSGYKAAGCPKCHFTGYHGRRALYEILPVAAELREQIKNNVLDISAYIVEHKIDTLKSNALKLVQAGTTSLEEVFPIISES